MKTKRNILAMLFAFIMSVISFNVFSGIKHEETATFKVYGNCGMCKKRIETALLKNQNIKKATWDVNSKMLTVVYDSKMINLDVIHKIIADVGHDTDKQKANDDVYKALPGCCQYERKK